MLKSGITTICIHKGLMPADYMTAGPDMWQYATVWDVGKAAKRLAADQFRHLPLGHAAVHRAARPRAGAVREATGRFDWVSDLADIPAGSA